ncbi:MAG: Mbeg1-like protein [Bacillota bacterium]
MYNIQSHVREHGDISLSRKPLDELDSLVLTQLCYMPMEGLLDGGGKTTVRDLWVFISLKYLDAFPTFYLRKCYYFLQSCAAAERYANLNLFDYVNHVDPAQETQFCACTFALPGGARFIAFRGTDLSIVGWKEDFNMSFMTVPAQREAVQYVERAAKAFGGPLILGGHSKGGNLALYAACHTTDLIRRRILQVYSFDGPGVDKPTLDGQGYQAVRGRVQSWVPQSSVIGMLLCYHPDYLVVQSDAVGLLQHDVFTWHVLDGAFQQMEELSLSTRVTSEAFHRWLDLRTEEERRFMVEVIFRIVSGIGRDDVSPLLEDFKGSTVKMFSAFSKLDPDMRNRAVKMFAGLLSTEAGLAVRQLLANVLRTQGN